VNPGWNPGLGTRLRPGLGMVAAAVLTGVSSHCGGGRGGEGRTGRSYDRAGPGTGLDGSDGGSGRSRDRERMHGLERHRPPLGTEFDELLSEPADLAERDTEGWVPSDRAAAPGADETVPRVRMRGVGRVIRLDRYPWPIPRPSLTRPARWPGPRKNGGMGWSGAFSYLFGGGERLPNELQSVELVEPVQVRVVAQTRRRGDEMAKTGRILVGWGGHPPPPEPSPFGRSGREDERATSPTEPRRSRTFCDRCFIFRHRVEAASRGLGPLRRGHNLGWAVNPAQVGGTPTQLPFTRFTLGRDLFTRRPLIGPVAQLEEQPPEERRVASSSPAWPTGGTLLRCFARRSIIAGCGMTECRPRRHRTCRINPGCRLWTPS
jgi:hypothetical protein